MEAHELHVLDAGLMSYGAALELQRDLVAGKIGGDAKDYLVFAEHPPVVTLGRSAREEHLKIPRETLASRGVEVFDVERGGDVTYHGPGQLVGYPIIDLKRAGLGVAAYLRLIEAALVAALARFEIEAFARDRLTGVWTGRGKIAAIGVAVKRWISFHGFALNANTGLDGFGLIVPCGLAGEGVTSMKEVLGGPVDMQAVKEAVAATVAEQLGRGTVFEAAIGGKAK